jgi:hypothetical protein
MRFGSRSVGTHLDREALLFDPGHHFRWRSPSADAKVASLFGCYENDLARGANVTTNTEGVGDGHYDLLESWVELLTAEDPDRDFADWSDDELCKEVLPLRNDPLELLLVAHELQFRPHVPAGFKRAVILYIREWLLEAGLVTPSPDRSDEVERPEGPEWAFPNSDMFVRRKRNRAEIGNSWREVGLLRLSGYVVGRTRGLKREERRRILNWVFIKDDLRDIDDPEYAAEWGEPLSSERLKKMADSIATFARVRAQSDKDYSIAIEHWEDDLEYLRRSFYESWDHRWPWPDMEL